MFADWYAKEFLASSSRYPSQREEETFLFLPPCDWMKSLK